MGDRGRTGCERGLDLKWLQLGMGGVGRIKEAGGFGPHPSPVELALTHKIDCA